MIYITLFFSSFISATLFPLGSEALLVYDVLESKKILTKEKIDKYKGFFDKYGFWALFLSWVPIIGDPLTLIAGILKYNFKHFFLIVLLAKFLRYLFLVLITLL